MAIDSHPEVMCGPEAAWITGRGMRRSPNFWDLTTFLRTNRWGPVAALTGVDDGVVYKEMATAIDRIMSAAARKQGKARWAEKTPESMVAVRYLHALFPTAKYVCVVRDGRDVALSTCNGSWKRLGFERQRVRNTYRNALRRWVAWNEQFRRDAEALRIDSVSIQYEELVVSPRDRLQQLFEFLDLTWNECVLHPRDADHDIVDPKGDGILSFYSHQGIDTTSVGRWKRELTWMQRQWTLRLGEPLLRKLGYAPTTDRS